MARHKDEHWNLPEGTPNGKGGTSHSWNSIGVAVLMDIRDELKRLNATLDCRNFQQIPATLRKVARNTEKPKKVKP